MVPLTTHLEARRFETTLKNKVDPQVCITELVRCENAIGKAFYAYIRIKPSEYMEYQMRVERGEPVNPNEYEILEYGWGENPPKHIQAMMEEKYGVDHEFADKVQALQKQALEKIAG